MWDRMVKRALQWNSVRANSTTSFSKFQFSEKVIAFSHFQCAKIHWSSKHSLSATHEHLFLLWRDSFLHVLLQVCSLITDGKTRCIYTIFIYFINHLQIEIFNWSVCLLSHQPHKHHDQSVISPRKVHYVLLVLPSQLWGNLHRCIHNFFWKLCKWGFLDAFSKHLDTPVQNWNCRLQACWSHVSPPLSFKHLPEVCTMEDKTSQLKTEFVNHKIQKEHMKKFVNNKKRNHIR